MSIYTITTRLNETYEPALLRDKVPKMFNARRASTPSSRRPAAVGYVLLIATLVLTLGCYSSVVESTHDNPKTNAGDVAANPDLRDEPKPNPALLCNDTEHGLVFARPRGWESRKSRTGEMVLYRPAGAGGDAFWTFAIDSARKPPKETAEDLAHELFEAGQKVHEVGILEWNDKIDRAFVRYELTAGGTTVLTRVVICDAPRDRLLIARESAPVPTWPSVENQLESITRSVQFQTDVPAQE